MKINGVEIKSVRPPADKAVSPTPKVEEQEKQAELNIIAEDSGDKEVSADANRRDATRDEIQEAVEALEETAMIFNKQLHFKVHEETEQVFVQVVNAETNEVIRQIPPEEILEVKARIDRLLGLFVDERV